MILVTGGAGFIGSNFILEWFKITDEEVVNIDNLTYASDLLNLKQVEKVKNYKFIKCNINNEKKLKEIFLEYNPRAIVHFAAESHVDRSIQNPLNFLETNVLGTFQLLNISKKFSEKKSDFKFIHISTDEVFGSLGLNEASFKENNRYQPNSPYSASKAASDHLVRAYFKTYGLRTITVNCSNNYGPFQNNEKLIPNSIKNALERKPIQIYGDGQNTRDWVHVSDSCNAIRLILENGIVGETYNIGGNAEMTNVDTVNLICDFLDEIVPLKKNNSYKKQITYIKDRLGHDKRYSVDFSKLNKTLGWMPKINFNEGLKKTIEWYLVKYNNFEIK